MEVKAGDLTVFYEEKGRGRPLLLLHAFPFNHKMWAPQLDELSKSARVLAPDLRGFGKTDAPPGPYWMDQLAQDCNNFLNAAGVNEPVVLGGLSMGGYILFAFLRKYPERVAGIILAATRAAPDSEEGKVNREQMAALALEQGSASVAEKMQAKLLSPKTYQDNPELVQHVQSLMVEANPTGIAGALLGMKERPDSIATLQAFDKPALVLHGANDQLIPVSEAEAMLAVLKRSSAEIIQEAGHMLNLEQPEKFNQAVIRFLEQA
jgi:3-oxoadipate enol-lactonase